MQIVKHDQSILGDNRDVKPRSLLESNISEESRNINYVNLSQRQSFEVISSNGIPSGEGFTGSHSTTLPVIVQSAVTAAQTSPADISYVSDAGDNKNDLLSEINEEQLFVENAGSFGQRLGVPSSDSVKHSPYSSTTTIQPKNISPHREKDRTRNFSRNRYTIKPLIKKNRKIQGVRLYNLGFSGHVDLAPEEPQRGFNAFPSTTLSPIVTTAIDQYSSLLPAFSNAIETSQKTVYSSTENPRQKESEIGLSNPQQINYALLSSEANQFKSFGLSASSNENSTFQVDRKGDTNWVTPIPKTTDGFSKPIVVAEVSQYKPFEYSTTFECEDNITSSTPLPIYSMTLRDPATSEIVATSNAENKGYDTISSIVLNPIQAGVQLVNAGKEHFISRTTNNLPFVEKKVDRNIMNDEGETKIHQSRVIYEKSSPTVKEKSVKVAEAKEPKENVKASTNHGIEIQKSIEIYHNAPIQEIHYPPQMFSQVIHIDQLQGGQRYIAENAQNAKQLQRSDASATNAPYEINHDTANIYQNIPEDKNLQSHVYVINQEFNSDNENAPQMNNIFQSGQRYYHIYPKLQESRDLKASIESKDERHSDSPLMNMIRIGTESQQVNEPSFQSYRSHDNRASYSSDINHGQQQIAVAVPQNTARVQSDPKISGYQIQSEPDLDLENSHQTIDLQVPVEFEFNEAPQKNIETQVVDIQAQQVKKLMEKAVHVPHSYSIQVEKIIEKKIPVPVEKIIEKKIPIPHPYPVHIQIPVDRIIEKRIPIPQLFPIPVEKIVEKKIPIPVQKIIPQPIPVPVKVPQPFAIEKVIEKPVHIPVPVEKIIEKKVPIPQPYPIEIEKIVERKIPIPVEVTKYLEKPVPIHVPYGVQYGVSYQQIMKPQNHNLYSTQTATSVPLYGLSIIKNQHVYNITQPYQTYVYPKPFIGFLDTKNNGMNHYLGKQNLNSGKKQFISHFTFAAQPSIMQSYSVYNPSHRRRHTLHRLTTKEKVEKDGYSGPVPLQHTSGLPHHNQGQQHGFQSKASNFHSTIATRSPSPVTTLRKVKQQDLYHPVGKGSFRQSKMEYGFKPPMIPSVQYDEETASKVES